MDLISLMGYRKDSPFKNNPYNIIHTKNGKIDMSATDIDLIGTDEFGNQIKMKKGTKKPYQFKGKVIHEQPDLDIYDFPIAQEGGSRSLLPKINFPENRGESTQVSKTPLLSVEQMKQQAEKDRFNKANKGNLSTYKPQSTISKAWEIAKNPVTAFGYKARGQNIPENFSRGDKNAYDLAVDAINPVTYAQAIRNTASNLAHPINTISTLGKGATNLLSNMVDGENVYNDGSNEEALGILGDAAMGLGPTGIGKRAINSPLPRMTKDLIRNGEFKELAALYGVVGAAELAPIISKTPGLRGIYKDLAYEIASKSGGAPSMGLRSMIDIKKRPVNYTGSNFGAPYTEETIEQGRSMLKQYIYGNQPEFRSINEPTRGLEKYTDRYGNLKVYEMESEIGNGNHMSNNSLLNGVVGDYGEIPVGKSNLFSLENKNPINPTDDVAGHLGWFERNAHLDDKIDLVSQDIWKFTPEDYTNKWGRGLRKEINVNDYLKYKQAILMDNAGKPFVTMSRNPFKLSNVTPKKSYKSGDYDIEYKRGGMFNPYQDGGEIEEAPIEEQPEEGFFTTEGEDEDYQTGVDMVMDSDEEKTTSGNPYAYGASMAPKLFPKVDQSFEPSVSTSSSSYTSGNKANYAFHYLIDKGLSKEQSAGVVANLIQESGNFRDDVISDKTTGDNNLKDKAHGVAQWRSDRYRNLIEYSKSTGKNYATLDAQLDFIVYEAQQRKAGSRLGSDWDRLRSTKDAKEATRSFNENFEVSADSREKGFEYWRTKHIFDKDGNLKLK